MESALYGVYTLVVLYQKSHLFALLTCSISDTPQLVCKHRTRALSMKYSIFIESYSSTKSQKVFVFLFLFFAQWEMQLAFLYALFHLFVSACAGFVLLILFFHDP